ATGIYHLAGLSRVSGRGQNHAMAFAGLFQTAKVAQAQIFIAGIDRSVDLPGCQGQRRKNGRSWNQTLGTKMKKLHYAMVMASLSLAGAHSFAQPLTGTSDQDVMTVLKESFSPVGDVKLDRLEQSPEQKACSDMAATGQAIPKEVMEKLLKQAMASIKSPADKQFLGDWKAGEKVAQSGVGLQFSDKPGVASGGNCYAC